MPAFLFIPGVKARGRRLLAGAYAPLPGDAGGAQRKGGGRSPPRGCAPYAARWSSGQDGGLSRRKREFDSPTGHHYCPLPMAYPLPLRARRHLPVLPAVPGCAPLAGQDARGSAWHGARYAREMPQNPRHTGACARRGPKIPTLGSVVGRPGRPRLGEALGEWPA